MVWRVGKSQACGAKVSKKDWALALSRYTTTGTGLGGAGMVNSTPSSSSGGVQASGHVSVSSDPWDEAVLGRRRRGVGLRFSSGCHRRWSYQLAVWPAEKKIRKAER